MKYDHLLSKCKKFFICFHFSFLRKFYTRKPSFFDTSVIAINLNDSLALFLYINYIFLNMKTMRIEILPLFMSVILKYFILKKFLNSCRENIVFKTCPCPQTAQTTVLILI